METLPCVSLNHRVELGEFQRVGPVPEAGHFRYDHVVYGVGQFRNIHICCG